MRSTDEARHSGVRQLYDKEWKKFEDTATVELDFLGRSEKEQYRLNRFKLLKRLKWITINKFNE